MNIDDLRFPAELYYDEHNQWARLDGEVVTVGITDYAQNIAGDVVFVELPEPPLDVAQGQPFGSIESGKWVGSLYAPVAGMLTEVNARLASDPRAVNREPYGEGWLVRIEARDPSELAQLMRVEAVRAVVEAELERARLAEEAEGGGDGEP